MSWQALSDEVRAVAHAELTARQLRVLQDTINGHSTLTIARALKLAEPTVRMHLERALVKMQPHLTRKDRDAA